MSFFENSQYLRFPNGLRDPWGSLGGPFGVQGGQGRSVERSGGPREVPEVSQGASEQDKFLFFWR